MDAEYDNITDLGSHLARALEVINPVEKIISIAVTLIAFFIISRLLNFAINRIFNENRKQLSDREVKRMLTLKKSVKSFSRAALLIVMGLIIMSFFFDVSALLAVAGVGTLAIGFGAQGLVEDVMSGFVIVFENQFDVGDYVEIEGHYGMVEVIGVRTTSIRELAGSLFIIHNGKIDRMVNYSKGMIIAGIDVGVAYDADIEQAMVVIKEVGEELCRDYPDIFPNPPDAFGVTNLGSSSVTIRVSVNTYAAQKPRAEAKMRQAVKAAFHRQGIEIPYDQIVVYEGKQEERV